MPQRSLTAGSSVTKQSAVGSQSQKTSKRSVRSARNQRSRRRFSGSPQVSSPSLSHLAVTICQPAGEARPDRRECQPARLDRLAGDDEQTGGHLPTSTLLIDVLGGHDAAASVADQPMHLGLRADLAAPARRSWLEERRPSPALGPAGAAEAAAVARILAGPPAVRGTG